MDQVKLETKWPPDRKSTVIRGASEFGIYKEPADGKRLRATDSATGCLLVLSLIAAAAVVLYFTFFDYTAQSTAQVSSVGPIVSYAKYVKEKQTASTGPAAGNRSADQLLAAVLGMKNAAENYTSTARGQPVTAASDDVDDDDDDDVVATKAVDESSGGRRMRLYPAIPHHRPPPAAAVYPHDRSADSVAHGNVEADGKHERPLNYRGGHEHSTDGLYGFGRRSDFPQLSAYRAPFPPKSVLAVMKYVTGPSPAPPHRTAADYMIAQESRARLVRPAEEVNRFLPDATSSAAGSKRFRNKFGPPAYLRPPVMAFPDDFMKPPSPGARYSMNFQSPDGMHASDGLSDVPLHTDAVFHSSSSSEHDYPDTPNRVKKTRTKKPISVMLDIYPMSDHEHEDEQVDNDEADNSEIFTSLRNSIRQSDRDNLLLRLNLFPKYNEGGRRTSKKLKYEDSDGDQKPTIHLTTHSPLQAREDDGHREDEYISKNVANVSKIR